MCAAKAVTIRMSRQDQREPWGFRLHGGTDYGCPLIVQKVRMMRFSFVGAYTACKDFTQPNIVSQYQ